MKNKNTVKTINYVMIITLVGKLMALLRDRLLGHAYGTGMASRAFTAASMLPRVFFDAIFVSAITMSFIPIFSKCMQEGGKKKAFEFSDVFITFVGILMIGLSLLGIIFSDTVAAFSVDGFDEETLKLCSDLLKILFPTMIFTGLAYSFIGILQSLDSFVIPALTSVIFNTVIILYFFGPNASWRIYGLAAIYLIGWILQAAIQVPELRKKGYRFRPSFDWGNGYLKQVGILVLPVMVSTWVQPLNLFVNTKFASRIYDGSATSALNFSNGLYTMIVGVFILSIMNVVFPKMSDLVNQGKKEELERLTGQILGISMLFVIPMMIGLMSLSHEVIELVYGGGEFDAFSIEITGKALFYFSLGMIGFALQTILARIYFAERRGKIPMIGAIFAIITNIAFCILLAERMEIGGLALASSLSAMIYGVVLMIPLLKRERKIFDRIFFFDILKMLFAALAMAGCIYWLKPFLSNLFDGGILMRLMYLLILTTLGVVVYGAGVFLLRVREVQNVKNFLLERQRDKGRNKES